MGTIFNTACDTLALDARTVTMLKNLYAEPHRFYHNMHHIETMLYITGSEGRLSGPLIAAILFHDAFYHPLSTCNEEISASLYDRLVTHPTSEISNIVSTAIMATKDHLNDGYKNAPTWIQNFLDYDLAGFVDSSVFNANTVKLYREFKPFYTDDEWFEGRKNFLVKHLSHQRLYWQHPRWEEPARDNIYNDLKSMENKSDYFEWLHCEVSDAVSKEMAERDEYPDALHIR